MLPLNVLFLKKDGGTVKSVPPSGHLGLIVAIDSGNKHGIIMMYS
jgi:hypothetical protein